MSPWSEIRREFPSLEGWTYLNTATYGQVPRRAISAMDQYFRRTEASASSDFLNWFDDADRLRASIGSLIGAGPDDIGFCVNASTALAILLNGIEWQPGDQVLTLEHEFPNNLYAPWFAKGVEFIQTPWSGFHEAITDRTRLVLLSVLNYSTGFRPPLDEIAPILRERGILLYLDGTQGLGALRIDVARLRPAMFACHAYKWMLSPTGAGFFYIDPELRARIQPQVIGWRSHKTWREVDHLHHGKPEFSDRAEKYEGGMIPFTLLYAMEASVNLFLEIGPAAIEQRTLELADRVRNIIRDAGGEAADGPTPIVAGRFAGSDVSAVARKLKEKRVVVAARHGNLRVSPYFYNNEEDLSTFARELRGAL